jgi:hypothetical protein
MFQANLKKIKILIYTNLTLIFFNIILVQLAKKFPLFIEKYYSRNFYLIINRPLSLLSGDFSFSLGEVLIAFQILVLIFLLILSFKNLAYRKVNNSIFLTLLIIFILLFNLSYYQIAWGLNNYRESIEYIFDLNDSDIVLEDLSKSYEFLVLETNRLKDLLIKYGLEEKNDEVVLKSIYKGYENASKKYPFIDSGKVSVKPLIISGFFSSSGYTGIYLPFFSEANINYMVPSFSKPFIASHEIAHQKGFSAEDDANFIGFLACHYHDDIFVKYSAYQAMMSYVGNSLYKSDPQLYREISNLRSTEVLEDIKKRVNFWDQHIVEKVSQAHNNLNDKFLKASNQPEGILSYSRVTELFIKAYKDKLIH